MALNGFRSLTEPSLAMTTLPWRTCIIELELTGGACISGGEMVEVMAPDCASGAAGHP